MSIFERIAIGTAAWGREYNGVKVPDKDIEKILGYCQCSDIDTIDTATAYGWDWTQANSYFNVVVKIQAGDRNWPYSERVFYMAHKVSEFREFPDVWNSVSIYEPKDIIQLRSRTIEILQLPYSLYDRRFEPHFPSLKQQCKEIHARSIFLRGKIIEDGIPAEECIKFVLANRFIDKIIIGADSFDQLRRNLDFIFKWKDLEKHDLALLDPRKWDKQ